MIVGSVLLVLVAGVLLGLGLVFLDAPLLYSSIGVSGLAALALVVGVRRLGSVPVGHGAISVRPSTPTASAPPPAFGAGVRPVGRATPRPVGRAAVPSRSADGVERDLTILADPAVPVDEPDEEPVSPAVAARIAGVRAEVVVIDGRPRYHLTGCLHLLGRDEEVLPVREAIEIGFTACALCRPAATLVPPTAN